MKPLFRLLLSLVCACTLAAHAAEKGTAIEAEAMVRQAVAFMKENGVAKTLAEANNPKGEFIYRDLYLSIYDKHGKVVAHGINPRLLGVDVSKLKDIDDKYFIQEIFAKANAQGSGTVDYKIVNPLTKEIEPQTAYFIKQGDYIISCGVYK